MLDVVLYLRYSSDKQSEQSIEGQQRICKAYCDSKGYNIVDVYIDRAISASKDAEKRLDFMKMLRDSDKKRWQAVIVYKLDRFARDRYDSAIFKAKLKKNGVKVISATENISDSPEGIILEAVLEGMAEFYSKELAQKVTRGMHETALKGNSCGGCAPLGYKVENKKWVINPLTAPAVKMAFEMYAKGTSVKEICDILNGEGYRTSKGVPFNKNSFKMMFPNKRYIGVYKYDDIVIENGIPAIIDNETFEAVQNRLKINGEAPARGKAIVSYLLSGKCFCGHCESNMVGAASTSHTGKKHFYYSCGGRRRDNGCKKSHVKKDALEQAVIEDTMKILTPEYIEKLADMAIEANKQDYSETEIPAMRNRLGEIDKSIANITKALEAGTFSPTLTNRLSELENEKRATEKRLLQESSEIIILEREHVVYWLSRFVDGDIDDPDFRRQLIDTFVKSVHIWDDTDGDDPESKTEVFITYNLTPLETRKITLNSGGDLTQMGAPKAKASRRT